MLDKRKFFRPKSEVIRKIEEWGPITFAQFMEICLYSPKGGFYSTRKNPINKNFTTSSHTHEEFGGLLAIQMEEIWKAMGMPFEFHLIEIGCGDGSLARSIQRTIQKDFPEFSKSLIHIAADLAPAFSEAGILNNSTPRKLGLDSENKIQKIMAQGINGLKNITGCIFSNELIDNFPVHRFKKIDNSIQELFTDFDGEKFVEVAGNPSTSQIRLRLGKLAERLPDGFIGEVNLRINHWYQDLAQALTKGFILTIDYGESLETIYSSLFPKGTITCFRKHYVSNNPYTFIGRQDITSRVDFTSLQTSGENYGFRTLGYSTQREFLFNLGFEKKLVELESLEELSEAQITLRKMAMCSLVDPTQMGSFKVLIQSKGINLQTPLSGFSHKHQI